MNEYLKAIKHANNQVLQEIYRLNFPIIKKHILDNSGDIADAEDVFQEGLVALFRRLQKEEIEIKTSFSTYFLGVCRYIWLKKLKKATTTASLENVEIEDREEIEEAIVREHKYTLFQRMLEKIGQDCKKVLSYYFEKKSFKEIAKLMDYTSEEYARRKKFLCKKSLMEKIKKEAAYRDLYNV
jgi:RNA polymerase sigma factor (sigma-70 family)